MSRNRGRNNKAHQNNTKKGHNTMKKDPKTSIIDLTRNLVMRYESVMETLLNPNTNLDALHKECCTELEVEDIFDQGIDCLYDLDEVEALHILRELNKMMCKDTINIYRKFSDALTKNTVSVETYAVYTRIVDYIYEDVDRMDRSIAEVCGIVVCLASAINTGVKLLDENVTVSTAASTSIDSGKAKCENGENVDVEVVEEPKVVVVEDEVWEDNKSKNKLRELLTKTIYEVIDEKSCQELNKCVKDSAESMGIDTDGIQNYSIENICDMVDNKIDLFVTSCKNPSKLLDPSSSKFKELNAVIVTELIIDMIDDCLGITKGSPLYKSVSKSIYTFMRRSDSFNNYVNGTSTAASSSIDPDKSGHHNNNNNNNKSTEIVCIENGDTIHKDPHEKKIEEEAKSIGMDVELYKCYLNLDKYRRPRRTNLLI